MRFINLLNAYYQAKRWRFSSRDKLARHQQKQLQHFIKHTLSKSPYFQRFVHKPFEDWAYMDKSIMMDDFEQINTLGIDKNEAWDKAHKAEIGDIESAIIHTKAGKITVGLSSGTSGQRGMFLVSQAEQARWSGVMLAKMLPSGLCTKERVALLLRANSNLYQSAKTPLLTLEYYNLFEPIARWQNRLAKYQPTILVAPTQVLIYLAQQVKQGKLGLNIRKIKQVISGAEVLSYNDKFFLQSVFTEATIGEVYQATEGFLASTCKYGNLHLHETHMLIEKEWLDEPSVVSEQNAAQKTAEQTSQKTSWWQHKQPKLRFIPIVTDFSRHTQPIVRYRMHDILHIDPLYQDNVCPCGDACTVIKRVEGRIGDTLQLPSTQAGENVSIFSDVIERAISRCLLGKYAYFDYEFLQCKNTNKLTLNLFEHVYYGSAHCPDDNEHDKSNLHEYYCCDQGEILILLQNQLNLAFSNLGVDISQLVWQMQCHVKQSDFTKKKRRIRVV